MNCSSGKARKNPLGMDRGRECRRGGSSVLALRRPRSTAFKDSSVVDDDEIGDESPNPRLRERPRKESISSSSSALFSSKRMKRQHVPPSPDTAAKARSNSDDETDEKTEDMDMSAFDSNEDLPPPPVSKRPSKLRPQGKALDEGGGTSVDLIAVPRKTRTAMMKRPPESLPETAAKQPSYPVSSSTFAPSNTALPPTSTRRLKPSSGKAKIPKIPKSSSLSSGISEQEVEVAETLFGLWRMVPNQPSPVLSEAKAESKEELKHNTSSSSPARSSQALQPESSVQAATSPCRQTTASISVFASTSPSHSAIPLAEAPKKKRHRIKLKPEDCIGNHSPQLGILSLASIAGGGSNKESKAQQEQPACSSGIEEAHAKTEETTGLSPSMPSVTSPSNANSVPVDPLSDDPKLSTGDDTKPPEAGPVSADLLLPSHGSLIEMEVPTQRDADLNLNHKDSNNMTVEPSSVSKSPQVDPPKLEQNTESQSQAIPNSCLPKLEIDLMAPPIGTVTKEDEKLEEDINMGDTVKTAESDFANSLTSKSWMDRGRENKVHREEEQQADESKEEKPNMEYLRSSEKDIQANVLNEGKREKEKVELSKQPSQQTVKSSKAESKNPKLEKSRPSPSLSPASTSPPPATTDPAGSIPLGMAGWPPTSLHPLGFYSPAVAAAAAAAAASWPGAATAINGHAGEDSGPLVAPFTLPTMQQQNWKRCGRHVYIAHFIELQQQIQRHPIWAASYGNAAAGLFGSTKQYNLIPPMDTLFGNGAHLSGPSSGISANQVSGNVPDSLQERDPGVSASTRGSRERGGGGGVNSNPDTVSKKPVSQQPSSTSQLQPTSPLQIGSNFGIPLMHNTAAASGLVPGTAAATGPNLTGITSTNSPVASANAGGGMMGIANGSAMAASAQAQYLQAMMQHTGFSFTFPQAAHFGPSFSGPSGHNAQHQATPMFSNTYYNPRLNQGLQSQQIQIGGGSYTGVQPSQQQPTSHPPSPSQTPLGSAVSQNLGIKEGGSNSATEIAATADARFLAAQQNMLGQMTSAAHGSKLASKAQQQAAGSGRMQQHSGSSQNNGPNAALQTSFNSSDVHASSQSYAISMGNTSRPSSVGSGPLGLASVAAIMAPQGHAMLLQNVGEATRSYPPQHSLTGQQQNPQQQQSFPPANKQKARATGAEDTRVNYENSSMTLGKERDAIPEVRKNQSKRNLPVSGVEVEGSFATGNGAMNMNSISATPLSQQSPQFSLGGPANPPNHNLKSGIVSAGHHHHVTKGVVSSSSADPSLVYYTDHSFATSFGKAASPGLSFQNPNRQGSVMTPQNTATASSKASQRASMGSSAQAGGSLSKHPQGSQQLLPSRASSPQGSSATSSLPLKASAVSSKTVNASLKSLYPPPQKPSSSSTASPGKRSTTNPTSVSNASHMNSSSGRIPQQQKQQGSGSQLQQQELIQSLQQQNSSKVASVGGQQQQQSMAQLYHNQQQWHPAQLPVHSLAKSLQSPPLQMRQNNALQQQQQIYQAQYHSQQQSVTNSLHQQGSSQQQQPPSIIASGNSQAQSQSFKHSQQRAGGLHTPQSPTASLGSGGNAAAGLSFPFPNPNLGTTSGRTDGVFSMQISGSRSALSSKPLGSPSGTTTDGSGSHKANSGGSVFLHGQTNCPPNSVNSGQKQVGET